MSLRLLAGLLVAAAILLTPSFSLLLLRFFPPPDVVLFNLRLCEPGERPSRDKPCVEPVVPGPPGTRVQAPTGALPPPPVPAAFGTAGAAAGPEAEPADTAGRAPGMDVRRRPGAGLFGLQVDRPVLGGPFGQAHRENVQAVRRHFMWINLVSLCLVVGCAVLLASVALRRPLRALLAAIGDIERGATPPAWAFSGPSELKTIGQSLHRLGRQLRSNLQERELMLAGLSHDLRSPLARIQAAIELRNAEGGRWDDTLRDIREIDHIVGQCIDFARDGQDEPLQDASLDAVVHALLGRGDAQTRLVLDAPQALPLRVGALRRALRNLVDNARVHGAAPVVVSTRVDDSHAVLSVADSGEGIEAAQWPRLLRPFARGSEARSPGGCGLGLAIVQRVADLHGGELRLCPREDGQAFAIELRLPLHADRDNGYERLHIDSD